jgi:hypothetical protein
VVSSLTRVDAALGPVRWCSRCAEWWPDDSAFWTRNPYKAGDIKVASGRTYIRRTSGVSVQCKACRGRREQLLGARAARPLRSSGHQCRSVAYCPVVVPNDRDVCRFHAGRTAGPLLLYGGMPR